MNFFILTDRSATKYEWKRAYRIARALRSCGDRFCDSLLIEFEEWSRQVYFWQNRDAFNKWFFGRDIPF